MASAKVDADRVHLIFAEDDLVFREIAHPAIERAGIQGDRIHMAENGLEALDQLQELQAPEWDDDIVIMLLDMFMPAMDGRTCATKVKELHRQGQLRKVPYLVCCTASVSQVSYAGEDDSDSTFHLTMPKPFSDNEVKLVLEASAKWWAAGATMCGDPATAGGSTTSSAPPRAAPGGSKQKAPFDIEKVEIIVVDDEPICRMALIMALTLQGIEEEKVVECDTSEDLQTALADAQSNAAAPLMVILAKEHWSDALGEVAGRQRKPFLVCTSLAGEPPSTSGRFDAVLPSNFQQADLKQVLDKFQTWWAR